MELDGKLEPKKSTEPGERSDELVRILADAVEIASIGFAIREPDGRYRRTNAAFTSLIGYDKEEMLTMSAADITPREWQRREEKILTEIARTGQPGKLEKEYIRKDGSRVPVELFVHPVYDDDGDFHFFYAFVTDITERKRAEDGLRESEERFRSLAENSFEGIIVACDGVVVDVNRAQMEMTGFERDEVIGRRVLELFTPRSREVVKRMVGLSCTDSYEAQMIRMEGSAMVAQIRCRETMYKGRPAWIATVQDITKQVNDKRRIEEDRARLRAILDTIPVGIIVLDAEGKLLESNDIAETIWNMGRHGRSFGHGCRGDGDGELDLDKMVAGVLGNGEKYLNEEVVAKGIDGSIATVLSSAAPIRDKKGSIIGAVCAGVDITDQKKMDREIENAKERAELYLDMLTHDMTNIHAAISGYLQLERDHCPGEARGIVKALECLDMGSRLIENVKRVQHPVFEPFETIELVPALERAIDSIERPLGRELNVRLMAEGRYTITGNDLVKDIFLDILTNAVEHSSNDVDIDVRVSELEEKGRKFYMVSIEDNGPGISDEMKGTVFSRTRRGLTKAVGKGFGLSIVCALIKELNGEIWVEDKVPGDHSKGARFVVLLPAVTATKKGVIP